MQERITRLDDALIDRVFQPMVDRLGARMTVDCFWLARTCSDVASLAWILSQAGGLSEAFAAGNVALACAEGTLIFLGLAALATLRRVFEGRQGSRSASSRANPLRPAMLLHRLCCLLGLAVQLLNGLARPSGFADLLIVAVSLMTAASVYVGACSSPPPVLRHRVARHPLMRLTGAR